MTGMRLLTILRVKLCGRNERLIFVVDVKQLVAEAPENFVIQDALIRCEEIIGAHNKIMCSVSGGLIAM